MRATALLVAGLFSLVVADDPPVAPTNPYCTGQCYDNFTIGWEFDSGNWVSANISLDDFWDLPANISTAKPGDILKWQDLDAATTISNWTIPGGMSLSRFQYASEDIDNTTVAASAFLLLPYSPRYPAKKLRTIVWSHGTAGIAGICSPSNHRNLYYDWAGPYAFAQLGYAVIGPDYAGLGTSTPRGFEYGAGWTHAADVAFSLVAARKRIGDILTDEWVSIGQSEGGLTAWRTNERLALEGQDALHKAGKFLGSVAIAPANRPVDLAIALMNTPPNEDGSGTAIVGYQLPNIANLYPDLHIEDFLSEETIGRLPLSQQSCTYGAFYLFSYMSPEEFYVNSSWTDHPAVLDWRKVYNREGMWKLSAPQLLVHGTGDGIVPFYLSEEDYNTTCSLYPDSSLKFYTYEGQNHDTVTAAAQVDYMAWVDDLFNGKTVEPGCARYDIHPLTDHWQTTATPYDGNLG
ncbi:hypothetical protein EsH8_VI_001088 [Colletotrichum jinshuiense]